MSSNEEGIGGGTAAIIAVVGVLLLGLFLSSPKGVSVLKQTQPPVHVSLKPFLIFKGYYVGIRNDSMTPIHGCVVTFTGASGSARKLQVGTISARETFWLDPSAANWTVEPYEVVSISADGYLSKNLDTNTLIQLIGK